MGESMRAAVFRGKHDIRLEPLMTHRVKLAQLADAYELFAAQEDRVLKVGITP